MLQILFDYIPYVLAGICILMTLIIIGCLIGLSRSKKKQKIEDTP